MATVIVKVTNVNGKVNQKMYNNASILEMANAVNDFCDIVKYDIPDIDDDTLDYYLMEGQYTFKDKHCTVRFISGRN